MQIIDIFVMKSMKWLYTYLNWLKGDGYIIDSVVVFDGKVIIVQHRTAIVLDTVTHPGHDDDMEGCGR